MRLSDHEWQVARQVCTRRQLEALDLWRRGAGKHRIGMVLNIDPSTARELVTRALRRLAHALDVAA